MRRAVGLVAAGALVGATIGALGTVVGELGGTNTEVAASTANTQVDSRAARAVPPEPLPDFTYVPPGGSGNKPPVGEKEGKTNGGGACTADPSYHDKDTKGMTTAAANAWKAAKEEALSKNVVLCAHEAKRSTAQQKAEFEEALERYNGNRQLTEQYVLPPAKSLHVKGLAVDVQPRASAAWLERTAGSIGWCRRYANEPWHFEYNKDYATAGCPALEPHP